MHNRICQLENMTYFEIREDNNSSINDQISYGQYLTKVQRCIKKNGYANS